MPYMDDEKDERELTAREELTQAVKAVALVAHEQNRQATGRWLVSGCVVFVTVLLPAGVILWRAMFNG